MPLLIEKTCKKFANGRVFLLKTKDGFPIETTDTFLPYYTKFCVNEHTNELKSGDVGSRKERFMIGVSVMSGCPVHCKFCATGKMKKWRNLTSLEIFEQIYFVLSRNPDIDPTRSKEFKINYTRMGEPFLNLEAVKETIKAISVVVPNVHNYVSTIGLRNSDFSWIEGNTTLQISLHSTNEKSRKELIPISNLMTIEELGQIRTKSNLKTTINMTLVDENDFDIEVLKKYFDPKYFFIKISPLNKNCISDKNELEGIIKIENLI
jgi:23S rRNA (adenine2503-C2)-methyltransferase